MAKIACCNSLSWILILPPHNSYQLRVISYESDFTCNNLSLSSSVILPPSDNFLPNSLTKGISSSLGLVNGWCVDQRLQSSHTSNRGISTTKENPNSSSFHSRRFSSLIACNLSIHRYVQHFSRSSAWKSIVWSFH
jgi:hypothetical protein